MEDVKDVIEEPQTEDVATEEVAAEEPQANPWSEFAPSKFGLDERYDSMSPDQFAREIKYRNEVYGRQANELGEMRRQYQEAQEKLKRFMEAADKPVEKQPEQDGITDEIITQQFYQLMEKGQPQKALELLLKDRMTPKFDDEAFQKAVDERVREHLNQFQQHTAEESIKGDPDYPMYRGYIDILRQDEHLGNTRKPAELLAFSKLNAENNALGNLVYSNMKQYPTMSFDDAKKFAELTLNSSSTEQAKKDSYRKTVQKINDTAPANSAAKSSQAEQINSMDDAFDVD